ncbi:hypothetical protein Q8F55_001242 [Vanrija albida]|uniref:F-box domain-containing protein n=1 Tax=Vanrija albida TaxID=181172 RepID=A0ABR3QFG3_9TREE
MSASQDQAAEAQPEPASLLSLPPEVLVDVVLPHLRLTDLNSLGLVNKELHALTNDPALWRIKTARDFAYRAEALALAAPKRNGPATESSGWFKRVYLGLHRPRAYVWGENANSRLGDLNNAPGGTHRWTRSVNTPMDIADSFEPGHRGRQWGARQAELDERLSRHSPPRSPVHSRSSTPGSDHSPDRRPRPVRLVDLQAGGWSFAARDIRGGVWVWGQLNGQGNGRFMGAQSWENEYYEVSEPARIPLPCRAEAIAQGRNHLLVLDTDNLVWELLAWGKAYHHTAPALTAPSQTGASAPGRQPHVAQVAAGWTHSAALTSSGDVNVWFPFTREYDDASTPQSELHGPLGVDEDDLSRALRWGTVGDVVLTLPPIPARPRWPDEEDGRGQPEDAALRKQLEQQWDEWEARETEKTLAAAERVVKIACGHDFVLALKGSGEVWLIPTTHDGVASARWEYLPFFSSPTVNHITAQFRTIASYSTPQDASAASSVLVARIDEITPRTGATLRPIDLPALDGKTVVQVVAGDWHYAALTAQGELYTWGENGSGQLGLGDEAAGAGTSQKAPTRVSFPTEADADGQHQPFVFAITAAGMHTGALAFGAKPKPREPGEAEPEPIVAGAGWPSSAQAEGAAPGVAGRGRFDHIFRIGFAGRGARFGGFAGRGFGGGGPLAPGGQ